MFLTTKALVSVSLRVNTVLLVSALFIHTTLAGMTRRPSHFIVSTCIQFRVFSLYLNDSLCIPFERKNCELSNFDWKQVRAQHT